MTQLLSFLGISMLSICGFICILFTPPLLIFKILAKISKDYNKECGD
jgi:hypothetical protein